MASALPRIVAGRSPREAGPYEPSARLLVGVCGGWCWRRGAEFVEGVRQIGGDRERVAAFDVAALEHVDEFAVAQKSDRGRRGRVTGEVAAGLLGGFAVLAGENGGENFGARVVCESACDCGARFASCASADGIHDDERG